MNVSTVPHEQAEEMVERGKLMFNKKKPAESDSEENFFFFFLESRTSGVNQLFKCADFSCLNIFKSFYLPGFRSKIEGVSESPDFSHILFFLLNTIM